MTLDKFIPPRIDRRKAIEKIVLGGLGASLLLKPESAVSKRKYENRRVSTPPLNRGYYGGFDRFCEVYIDSSIISGNALSDDKLTTLQKQSMWCWAACLEMVFSYWGYVLPQEEIVRENFGDYRNWPAKAGRISANLNKNWEDNDGEEFDVASNPYTVNIVSTARDLDADKPLIIGTQNHAMVLTSLKYIGQYHNQYDFFHGIVPVLRNIILESAKVIDPLKGEERFMRPDEWNSMSFLARVEITPDKRKKIDKDSDDYYDDW